MPKIEDLAEAWSNIYAEYCDLNEDNQTIYLLHLQREIALLSITLSECEPCLYFLSFIYHEGLVEKLKEYHYDYPFNPADQQQYNNSLEAIYNRLSPLRLKLENAKKEYEQYLKSRITENISEDYFDKMLIRLSRFYRILLRAQEITVREFVLMLKEYLEYIQAKKQSLEPENT